VLLFCGLLAATIAALSLSQSLGACAMKRLKLLAIALAPLMVAACATAGTGLTVAGALAAAGYSLDTYCALTPEARAEVRRKFGLRVPIINCDDGAQ
jgi:hypothetical protein